MMCCKFYQNISIFPINFMIFFLEQFVTFTGLFTIYSNPYALTHANTDFLNYIDRVFQKFEYINIPFVRNIFIESVD